MLLPLVYAPDKRLWLVSEPVEKVDNELRKFLDDLLETMYVEDGAGLAAVQVGVLKRIFIIDIDASEERNMDDNRPRDPMFFINPIITAKSEDKFTHTEGCLSFPGIYVDVERHKWVDIEYLDYDGKEQKLHAIGWQAIAIQHEFDHLNAVTFADRVSKLKHDLILKKAEKIRKRLVGQ